MLARDHFTLRCCERFFFVLWRRRPVRGGQCQPHTDRRRGKKKNTLLPGAYYYLLLSLLNVCYYCLLLSATYLLPGAGARKQGAYSHAPCCNCPLPAACCYLLLSLCNVCYCLLLCVLLLLRELKENQPRPPRCRPGEPLRCYAATCYLLLSATFSVQCMLLCVLLLLLRTKA